MQWVKRGVVIALVWSGSVWADPAQELVNLLNSEQQAEQLQAQMQAQMIPLIIRGAGEHAQELAQHRDVLEAWVSRYLSWGAMSSEVAAIYRKHFTEAELKALIAFGRYIDQLERRGGEWRRSGLVRSDRDGAALCRGGGRDEGRRSSR